MYAIISVKGQQFRVEPGTVITTNRIAAEPGATMALADCVLLAHDGEALQTGAPTLADATVELEVMEHFRGKKLTVFKMKRRKHMRRKHGHRQDHTRVRVTKIDLGGTPVKARKSAAKQAEPEPEAAGATETAEVDAKPAPAKAEKPKKKTAAKAAAKPADPGDAE
jgi:large subunit ribosomal protein L21